MVPATVFEVVSDDEVEKVVLVDPVEAESERVCSSLVQSFFVQRRVFAPSSCSYCVLEKTVAWSHGNDCILQSSWCEC